MKQRQAAIRTAKKVSLALAVSLLAAAPAAGQTLARPGWVGSGLNTEAWWKHLVIYEIDTRNFQAANSDGTGTLKGITQRLDYIRSLGVDAILLDSLAPNPDATGASTPQLVAPIDPALGTPDDFDQLSLEASRRGLRILLNLPQPDLATARFWLNRGVAGFRILPASAPTAPPSLPASLQELHKLLASAIGQRILIANPDAHTGLSASPQLLPVTSILSLPAATPASPASAPEASGTAAPTAPTATSTVAGLRAALTQAAAATHGDPSPLPLLLTDAPDHPRSLTRFSVGDSTTDSAAVRIAKAKLLAAVLLGTRAAALIDYGQEIGLPSATASPSADPQMLWGSSPKEPATSSAPPAPAAAPEAAAPQPPAPTPTPTDGFGAYHPYVPPNRKPADPAASHTAAPPADPSTVAGQDANPESLLSFYRQLIQLHHGNPTLRDGDTVPLDHDAQNVLVWVRKPRAVTSLSPAIFVLCNFSAAPVTLSLKADATRLHLRGSFLRTVLRSDNGLGTMHLDGMTLPPYAVYIGELRY
jgi:glycosidase